MINYREYDPQNPPKSRIGAYQRALKKYFWRLLAMGLLLTLACAPLITFNYLITVYKIGLDEEVAANTLTAQESLLALNSLQNIFYLCALLLCLLPALVVAGMAKALKCIAWKDPAPVRENFGGGIKENFLRFAPVFLINVLWLWVSNFTRNSNPDYNFVYYLPTVGWFIILLPLSAWYCSVSSVYKDKTYVLFMGSLKFYAKTLPLTLCFTCLAVLPLGLLLFMNVAWVQLVIPLLYTFLWLPPVMLACVFWANSVYDKYINVKSFPELVEKGL
jgi:hypothetical protein